jgi:hypothetical protein
MCPSKEGAVAIDYESLSKFVRANGTIKLYAPNGEVTILKDGTPQVFEAIENATTFVFDGKEYTRAQFEKLLATSDRD